MRINKIMKNTIICGSILYSSASIGYLIYNKFKNYNKHKDEQLNINYSEKFLDKLAYLVDKEIQYNRYLNSYINEGITQIPDYIQYDIDKIYDLYNQSIEEMIDTIKTYKDDVMKFTNEHQTDKLLLLRKQIYANSIKLLNLLES